MKGLTHSGGEWQNTWPEGWWPTGKFLFFSASFIQKRKKLKHQTLWPSYNLSVFDTLHSYCQCPWLSRIYFFLVKENHLTLLPTMIETWCTCRCRPCWNAAKPQRPCHTVALVPNISIQNNHVWLVANLWAQKQGVNVRGQ
jgi:hypothetical protein